FSRAGGVSPLMLSLGDGLQSTQILLMNNQLACCLSCLVFGLTAAGSDPSFAQTSATADLPKVSAVKPVKKPIAQKTEQPGRIEAFLSSPLFSKSTGYVQAVNVDIGDRVTGPKFGPNGKEIAPGQPLVVISAPEIEEQLHQAEAKVLQVKADTRQFEAA